MPEPLASTLSPHWTDYLVMCGVLAQAFFVLLTLLVYRKMNSILTKTNEINERSVVEARVARHQATTPLLAIEVFGAMHAHLEPDHGALSVWKYQVRIVNVGLGRAFDVRGDAPWPKECEPLTDLGSGGEYLFEEKWTAVAGATRPENRRNLIRVSFRDRFRNEWEASFSEGKTTNVMTRELVQEAVCGEGATVLPRPGFDEPVD